MKYKEALQNFNEVNSAHKKALQSLKTLERDLSKAKQRVPELHDQLTDVMAKAEVGDATIEDVDKVRDQYKEAEKSIEEIETKLKAKQKSIPLYREKVYQAKREFLKHAYPHFQEKSAPVIAESVKALKELEKVNNKIQKLWDEMERTGVDPADHIPPPFKDLKLKINHLKRPMQPDEWERLASEVNQNYKREDI